MTSPIYSQGQHNPAQMHQPGPQPMMREISHDGQVGGGVSYASAAAGGQQQQHQQSQGSPIGANTQHQQSVGQPQQMNPQAAASPQVVQQPMNLASVLHYLQSEWRRWERDRNEWEIERAEMRARIALLEGERRSAENLKMDMLRRVKMLEFALKQERSKSLSANGGAVAPGTGLSIVGRGPQSAGAVLAGSNSFASMTPAKTATVGLSTSNPDSVIDQKEVVAPAGHSPKNGSEAGAHPDQTGKKLNGIPPNASETAEKKPMASNPASTSRAGSVDSIHALGSAVGNTWKSTVSMPIRDPKSRARSREYLKQCLQEISYLTSPAAMNPLPNRLPLTLTAPSSTSDPSSSTSGVQPSAQGGANVPNESAQASLASGTILEIPERPRKTLSDGPFPAAQPGVIGLGVKGVGEPVEGGFAGAEKQEPRVGLSNLAQEVVAEEQEQQQMKQTDQQQAADQVSEGRSHNEMEVDPEQGKVLTAIYKPESKEAWKQALKQANEQADKTKSSGFRTQGASDSSASDSGDPLETMSNSSADTEATAIHEEDIQVKTGWKPTRQLKSHLDAVQAVAFGPDATVVSGSWDCTVKVWRLATDKTSNRSNLPDELEPQITFRGHLAPVTSLAVSTGSRKVFSGSLDSSIRVWNLPSAEHHTYSPHDPKLEDDTLVGHTDGVWALALLPSAADEPEGYLVSASSDGSVKVWSTTGEVGSGHPLVSGWKYDGTADHNEEPSAEPEDKVTGGDEQQEHRPVPVAVTMYHPDLTLVLVGYNNGVIKLFEIKTGREVLQYENGESGASLTDVICHPTLSLAVAAMNDGTIRIYDIRTGKIQETIQAHSSTINALRVDPTSSSEMITAGDDLSIKVWNLETLTSTHEWTAHRKKGEQGVLALDICDDAALVAAGSSKDGRGKLAALVSGGADGTVRLYTKA